MKNDIWHVALVPGTTKLQDVILADVDIGDLETICCLLATDHLKGKTFKTEWGGFLLMYAGEYERPFPSVMIWRFEDKGDDGIIKDIRYEDGWIIERVWRDMLMPEETDAEYVPPERFLIMTKPRDDQKGE